MKNWRGILLIIILVSASITNVFAQRNYSFSEALQKYEVSSFDSAFLMLTSAEKEAIRSKKINNFYHLQLVKAEIFHRKADFDSAQHYIKLVANYLLETPNNNELHLSFEMYFLNHYIEFSILDSALYFLNKVESAKNKSENIDQVALFYHLKGNYFNLLGRYKEAILYQDSAILFSTNKFLKLKAVLEKQLMHYKIFEYQEQALQLNKSLLLAEKIVSANHWIYGKIYEGFGYSYLDFKKFILADDYFKRSHQILSAQFKVNHVFIGNIYNLLGITRFELYHDSVSLEYHHKALKIRKTLFGENNINTSYSYTNIGNYYNWHNLYDTAIQYYEKATNIRTQTFGFHHPKIANAYIKIGNLYFPFNTENALKYYHYALCSSLPYEADTSDYFYSPEVPENFVSRETAIALSQKALLFSYNQNLFNYDTLFYYKKAFDCYKGLDKLIDNSHKAGVIFDIPNLENTYNLNHKKITILYWLYEKTGDPQYINYLLYGADRTKTYKLFDEIQFNKSNTDSTLQKITDLKHERFLAEKELINAQKNDSLNNILKTQIIKIKQELFQHQSYLQKAKPELFYFTSSNQIPDYRIIQTAIPQNTAIIDFHISYGSQNVIALFNDTILCSNIPLNKTNLMLLKKYFENETEIDTTYLSLAYSIFSSAFSLTLRDMLKKRKIKNLIIIPDGEYWLIPFEALISKPLKDIPGKIVQLPFLLKDYEISYSISLNFAYHWLTNQNKIKYDKEILLVAPVFDKSNVCQLDNLSKQYQRSISDSAFYFNNFIQNNMISALPFSEHEVLNINDLFSHKKKKSELLIREKANMNAISEKSDSSFRIIHIASHAFSNINNIDFSGILLSGEHSIVFGGDIKKLRINADLIVLSACETGYGKPDYGIGIQNLAINFAVSGTPNIISTLWNVDDASASLLMVFLYKNIISAGFESYVKSLRKAKLKLIKKNRYDAPYFWAPYTINIY